MPVAVRRATKQDAAKVAEFSIALAEQHLSYDPARFARLITREGGERFYARQSESQDAAVLVAELDGNIVGFAYLQYEPVLYAEFAVKAAWLHDIFVDELVRGRNIGKRLLDAVAAEAKSLGANKVLLSVAAKNTMAQGFFEKQGFRTTMHEMMLEISG